jgi:hypothetical protein
MTGLEQCLSDLEEAFNKWGSDNGFPEIDLTPLPPAQASKPGLYLGFQGEHRSAPPDTHWLQPVGSMAEFDLYAYFMTIPDEPLTQTIIRLTGSLEAAVQQLNIDQYNQTKPDNFRSFIREVVPMYDWAARSWAGLMFTIVCDSYRKSTDG